MSAVLRFEVQALRAYVKRLEEAIKRGDLAAAQAIIEGRYLTMDVPSGGGE